MTTTKPSLRDLARHLGCSHAALSKQVHAGLLRAGVGIDARGRVVVTDFQAAAAEWKGIHVPRIDEILRRAAAAAAATAATEPEDFFADLSKQDLLERWVAYDLLASTLVEAALSGAGDDRGAVARAFIERTTALLHEAAPRNHADHETLVDTETLLGELVNQTLGEPSEAP